MRKAFSLVELSIVLVILGLLTGGILSGQALIRASELRSITSDFSRYHAALNAFRDRYFSLPGDMMNATTFWGSAAAGCPNSASTGTETCNGDGNAYINATIGNLAVAGAYAEGLHAWKQMANAGMVEGSYTTTGNATPNTNIPASKMAKAGYQLVSIDTGVSGYVTPIVGAPYTGTATLQSSAFWSVTAHAAIIFGSYRTLNGLMSGYVLKPEEAWNIDTKIDDGKPGTGKLVGAVPSSTCHTAATNPADYDLSLSDPLCSLIYTAVP